MVLQLNIQVFPYDKERKAKGPLFFNIERPICQFIAEDEDLYPGLHEKSNLPEPGTCPLPKVIGFMRYENVKYYFKIKFSFIFS